MFVSPQRNADALLVPFRWFRLLPNNLSRHSRTVCVFFFAAWQAWHFVDSRCQMRGRRGTSRHRARHISESRHTGCSKVSPLSHRIAFFCFGVAKTQLFIVHSHPVGSQNAWQAWHIVTCNCSYNLTARQSMLQNGHHSRTFFVFLFRVRDRRNISCKSDLVWRAKIAPPALRAEIGRFAKEFV